MMVPGQLFLLACAALCANTAADVLTVQELSNPEPGKRAGSSRLSIEEALQAGNQFLPCLISYFVLGFSITRDKTHHTLFC